MAHTVTIKDFAIEMEIKNRGIELEVRIDDAHKGDLIISKTGLEWCRGKTQPGNGAKIPWSTFIEWAERKP